MQLEAKHLFRSGVHKFVDNRKQENITPIQVTVDVKAILADNQSLTWTLAIDCALGGLSLLC